MSRTFRAILQGILGVIVGTVLGALVGGIVALFTREFLPESILLGAVMVGAMSALMSTLFEDWSIMTLVSAGFLDSNSDDHQPLGKRTQQTKSPVESALMQPAVQEQRKTVILFLCTGNSARSQMAEGFLKRYAGDLLDVYSAGLRPRGIHPLTIEVMREVGIDISGQHSKALLQFLGKLPVRVAITVCAPNEENCPTNWPGPTAKLSWPFQDPVACEGSEGERLAKFRSVRDQVDQKIKNWLKEARQ